MSPGLRNSIPRSRLAALNRANLDSICLVSLESMDLLECFDHLWRTIKATHFLFHFSPKALTSLRASPLVFETSP